MYLKFQIQTPFTSDNFSANTSDKFLNTFQYKYFCIWPHAWNLAIGEAQNKAHEDSAAVSHWAVPSCDLCIMFCVYTVYSILLMDIVFPRY